MTSCRDLGQLDLNTLVTGVTNLFQTQNIEQVLKNPFGATIKSVTVATNFSPPMTYTGGQLDAMYRDKTPNPYLQFIKPTVTLDTAFGKQTIAPYGPADPKVWRGNVQRVVSMAATVVLLGGTSLLLLGYAAGSAGKK